MDRKDIAILEKLQGDGSLSNKDLARRVGLSPSACLERVRKLERDGVIQRYTAILGLYAFDNAVEGWGWIALERRTSTVMETLQRMLLAADIVVDLHELTGPTDLLVRFVASSIDEWRALERALEAAIPEIASIRHGITARTLRSNGPLALARLIGVD